MNLPRAIDVTRTPFRCRKLFSIALLDRFAFEASEVRTVEFWKVSGLLCFRPTGNKNFAAFGAAFDATLRTQGPEKISDSLGKIFLPISLAKVLNGLENKYAVHPVVTANGSYQSADAVEAPDHHRDKRPRLLSELPRSLLPTGK